MFRYFFHWYDGGVWGNLLASGIVGVPVYIWGKFHITQLHRKLDIQDYLHSLSSKKIDEIHKEIVKE